MVTCTTHTTQKLDNKHVKSDHVLHEYARIILHLPKRRDQAQLLAKESAIPRARQANTDGWMARSCCISVGIVHSIVSLETSAHIIRKGKVIGDKSRSSHVAWRNRMRRMLWTIPMQAWLSGCISILNVAVLIKGHVNVYLQWNNLTQQWSELGFACIFGRILGDCYAEILTMVSQRLPVSVHISSRRHQCRKWDVRCLSCSPCTRPKHSLISIEYAVPASSVWW